MSSPAAATAMPEEPGLDGGDIKFTAISVTHAYGCNGWEPYDEVDGASVFVRPGHLSDTELDALEERLDDLWPPRRGGTPHASTVQAIAELGVELPSVEAGAPPVWGPDFAGTLQDWVAAARQYAALQRETGRAWERTFAHARQKLLLREGFTPEAGLNSNVGRTLVSDYGCMCGCYSGSDGEANLILTWRSEQTYVHPAGIDLDAALAKLPELETAGFQGAVEANVKTCEQLSIQGYAHSLDPYLDVYRLERDPENPTLTMTWAEWDAARTARKTALLDLSTQAQVTGDWDKVRAHVKAQYGRELHDPATSGRSRVNSYLYSRDIQRLSAADALVLWTALSDSAPPAWLTTQAAAEPTPTGTDRDGHVAYKPVPGAAGTIRIPNRAAEAFISRGTPGLSGEDPDIPSVEAD